jgi:hypothetical protein
MGFLDRLRGRKVERHELKVKLTMQPGEDREEFAREIEAEVARQLSAGNDHAATRAALEDIAARHGAQLKEFEDS